MTNTREIIAKLKEVREEKGYSYSDILDLMEKNGDYIAKSTLSRVFAEGSEELSFKYDETLKPIANALLDIDTIEEDDTLDTQALKVMLRYKADKIKELETALDHEKIKYHDRMDKEREQFHKSLDFLKEQVSLKDKRIDQLLDANVKLLEEFMNCPKRNCK